MGVLDRVKVAWNAFRSQDPQSQYTSNVGPSYSSRPDRARTRFVNDKSIVTSIYNRIAIDVASVDLRHVLLDDQRRYSNDIDSALNDALDLEPNLDQGPRAWRQDICQTMFDAGAAAIVPVDTARDIQTGQVTDIYTLRIGTISSWHPAHVRVSLYNEKVAQRQDILLEKRSVAIVENPLYSVMNSPNGTLQRLLRKLTLLDSVDEATSSGKLDMIIQLPYVIKSDARKEQAEKRREDIEFQLKGSKYGIAYIDGTEKITQLNRPVENNLLSQIESLTAMLYGQLGITTSIMDGTADEKTMTNYYRRTIEPIVESITEAMRRAFIPTEKNERIMYFRNPFSFLAMSEIAKVVDAFSRNEILAPNEIRGFMGIPPSKDPKADQLINSNMPQSSSAVVNNGHPQQDGAQQSTDQSGQDAVASAANSGLDDLDNTIDSIFKDLGVSPNGSGG